LDRGESESEAVEDEHILLQFVLEGEIASHYPVRDYSPRILFAGPGGESRFERIDLGGFRRPWIEPSRSWRIGKILQRVLASALLGLIAVLAWWRFIRAERKNPQPDCEAPPFRVRTLSCVLIVLGLLMFPIWS
jgi:hypothetical protein